MGEALTQHAWEGHIFSVPGSHIQWRAGHLSTHDQLAGAKALKEAVRIGPSHWMGEREGRGGGGKGKGRERKRRMEGRVGLERETKKGKRVWRLSEGEESVETK